MEKIKRNGKMENNSDIDINQSLRDTDGDRGIEMDVVAEVERIINRRVEQDDLDKNAKKIRTNIIEKMKGPMNLEVVHLINVDRKKVKKKTQAVNRVLSHIHTESIIEANLLILVGANLVAVIRQKEK